MALELSFSVLAEEEGPADLDEEGLERLAAYVIQAEGGVGNWQVSVALVNDERIQTLHRDFMGVDTPTDVMTFPLDDGSGTIRGGDIAISVDHAASRSWGLSPSDEIRFLLVHGLLHLLGWRDESVTDREQMLERQRQLLDDWSIR